MGRTPRPELRQPGVFNIFQYNHRGAFGLSGLIYFLYLIKGRNIVLFSYQPIWESEVTMLLAVSPAFEGFAVFYLSPHLVLAIAKES